MNTLHNYDADDFYPESDGLPMAENTEQYEWLVKIKENLEILFANRADVFVAGDLFWYPVPDRKSTPPLAPDVMVAFGRPKGKRGSYRQWEENNIAPQVVFEILSPSNTTQEMQAKKNFYEKYGVQEYYVYDPERNRLEVWMRKNDQLQKAPYLYGCVSHLLGIEFKLDKNTLHMFYPDGQPFLSSVELHQHAKAMEQQAKVERKRSEAERKRAKKAEKNAEKERQEKEIALQDKATALLEIERLRALLAEKSLR
jgi:Uma2 family endonuclease